MYPNIRGVIRLGKLKERVVDFLRGNNLRPTRKAVKFARAELRKRGKKHHGFEKDLSVREASANWQIIYGSMRVGGVITYIKSTNNNSKLQLLITVAGHEVEEITTMYFNGTAVTFSGATVDGAATGFYAGAVSARVNLGTTTQTAIADLVTASGGEWTSAHRQRNWAGVYLELTWDAARFPNSIPEITFQIKGKKVYDPRTGTYRGQPYSSNAALCIADYMMDTVYGMKIPSSEIYMGSSTSDIASLWYAAGVCDDSISLAAGGTEKRYSLNGFSDTGMSHGDTLRRMCSAMAGAVTFSSGTWRFWPGKWRTPVLTIDEDDCISELKVSTLTSRRDSFNTIRGTFISAENNYENTDFPLVDNSTYIALDNGEVIAEDISLPYTTTSATAQRLAKIELEKIRQAIIVQGKFKLRIYGAEAGDNIYFTFDRFGWSSKAFEVQSISLVIDENDSNDQVFICVATLRETASGVFDWSAEENTHDIAPNSTLPNALVVAAPTGLTLASGTANLYQRLDGVIFSRIKASWTSPTDAFVTSGGQIEIQHKLSSSGTWNPTVVIGGGETQFFILEVQDGESYDVRIRAVSMVGTISSWETVTGHTVVGKTAAPSNVAAITYAIEESGLRFAWANISDLDLKEYEIRVGASWAAGTLLHKTKATYYLSPFLATGTYTYRIKARDTSLNYSTTDATVSVVITAPSAVQRLTSQVTDNHLMLDWDAPATIVQPIARYEIYKGTTFATAVRIGVNDQTVFNYLEPAAGTFTYWVRAVDGAGNFGATNSLSVKVFDPPDYASQADAVFEAELGVATNVIVGTSGGTLLNALPVSDVIDTTSWFDAESGITLTSGRVSSWADQRSVISAFTQATASARPYLTERENRENQIQYSEELDNAVHTKTRLTVTANSVANPVDGATTADTLVENTGATTSHYLGVWNTSTFACIAGVPLRLSVYAKRKERDICLRIQDSGSIDKSAYFNLNSGTVTSTDSGATSGIESIGSGWYRCSVTVTPTTTGLCYPAIHMITAGSSSQSYTGDGASGVYCFGVQVANSAALNSYLPTTSLPRFRGINGRQALRFIGAQGMASSSAMSSMVSTSAKIFYIAGRLDNVATSQTILEDNGGNLQILFNGTHLSIRNDDGSADTPSLSPPTAGQAFVLRVRHDAGTLYAAIDTGSGFGTEVSAASGSTTSLAAVINLGFHVGPNGYVQGDIAAIVSYNSGVLDYRTDAIAQVLHALYLEPVGRLDTGIAYGTIIGPATVTETFQQHADASSFTTLQSQIDAGYLYPFQPGPVAGSSVVLTENFGAVFSNVIVKVTWDEEILQGTATVVCQLETSTDGVTYTAYPNQSQAFISSLQYLRTTFTISDLTTISAFRLSNIRRKLDVKIRTDSGTASLISTDSGGTQINFNLDFYSVSSITLTLDNTAVVKSAVVFTGGVNPVGFKGLAWDNSSPNVRLSSTAYWQARGIVTG